jgi:membrane-associated protease RseP (regulator of RpoE activity)
MTRLTGWAAALLALILLLLLAGTGSITQRVNAATAEPTLVATEVSTAEPDENADNRPISFTKAPSPEAGTIGISLGDTPNVIRLQTVVANGPAGKAGMQVGDEIVEVNGKAAQNRDAVIAAIVASKPGNTITFTVNRKGEKQEIKVPVSTRREVYCPLSAPTTKAGKAVVRDPIIAEKNWAIASGGSPGIALSIQNGKLTFVDRGQGGNWAGLATLKASLSPGFLYTVDVTQSSQNIGGLILNYRSNDGFYLLQMIPNGSWTMTAIYNDGSTAGSLSFSEPSLKAADENDPNSTTTNTVTALEEGGNIYISFNGTFACGTPLTQFGDPPIQRGSVGVFGIVYNTLSSTNPTFSNISLFQLAASATPGATQAATPAATVEATEAAG